MAKEQEVQPVETKREWVKPEVREMCAGSAELAIGAAPDGPLDES